MKTQIMTVDELIKHLSDIRQDKPPQKPTLIDIIIEQMLEQQKQPLAKEFFESVK